MKFDIYLFYQVSDKKQLRRRGKGDRFLGEAETRSYRLKSLLCKGAEV